MQQDCGYHAPQKKPRGSAQNAGQPATALLPGEELDAAPIPERPARDARRPRAEKLLYAEQQETQRWRAQAMRLKEELQSAQTAAHSERQACVTQLRCARASDRVFSANCAEAEHHAVNLMRQLEKAEAANASLKAQLQEAWQDRMVAQAAAEKEAQRAADLDASKAAMQQQLAELLGANKVQKYPFSRVLPLRLHLNMGPAPGKQQDTACPA